MPRKAKPQDAAVAERKLATAAKLEEINRQAVVKQNAMLNSWMGKFLAANTRVPRKD